MGITIEITTSNIISRTCATTIYNTANGALFRCISGTVQLLTQIFIDIFVSIFLLFCCIQNTTQGIKDLSGAKNSANVKLVKTYFHDMGITIEITTSNNVTRTCETTIYNTANGALNNSINAFFQFVAQIFNVIFVCKILFCCYIRNPT